MERGRGEGSGGEERGRLLPTMIDPTWRHRPEGVVFFGLEAQKRV